MDQAVEQEQQQAVVVAPAGNAAMMSPEDVQHQFSELNRVIAMLMKDGSHYGTIPGTSKPTLYQPGAQMLCVAFKLRPRFTMEREDLPGDHRSYEATCELYTLDGQFVGMGMGTASTMESRYRWRNGERTCPSCGVEGKIIKGKEQYGGGWICFARKGGCGAKFADNDPSITSQHPGRVENPDPADCWNTVKKIAAKRALVHATINATGCSDQFTQDIEDGGPGSPGFDGPRGGNAPPPRQQCQQPQRQAPPPQQQERPPQEERDSRLASEGQIRLIMAKVEETGTDHDELKLFCRIMLQTLDGQPVTSRKDIQKRDVDMLLQRIDDGTLADIPLPPQEEVPI